MSCVVQKQLDPTPLTETHNTLWSAVNMPVILLQLYQFTIKLNVILLSSNGPKQVNYSIHSLSAGLSFQRQTVTVPEDHPHPLSVDLSLAVWSCCMQTLCACVSMYVWVV